MKNTNKIMKINGFSQIVAVQIKNLLSLAVGMNVGYVTILIPSLTDGSAGIQLTSTQTSWLSSILPISSLIGSLVSGPITEPFGRKRAMMVLTIPLFIPWICFNFVTEPWHIYVCLAIQGLTNGLIEAPVLAYVAEISEPHLRGMLSGTTTLSVMFGLFIEFLIGSLLHWQTASLASSAVPILAFCLLSLLPESPYWLLSHNYPERARRSLAWLRNWTTIENIEKEFQEIQENANKKLVGASNVAFEDDAGTIPQTKLDDNAPPIALQTSTQYLKKSFLWPLFLVYFLFSLSNFIGSYTLQTFAVVIFSTFKVPMDKYYATVLLGAVGLIGCALCIFFVRFAGKRIMGLFSISVVCICNILLCIYSYFNNILYLDFSSTTNSFSVSHIGSHNWIPLFLLVLMSFISRCGAKNLPWMLIGELFSNETRGVGCGLATSAFYLSGFAASRLYLSMVSTLSLPGVFLAQFCICIIGLFVIYFALPETEGKTLEEIANHFDGSGKLNNKVNRT